MSYKRFELVIFLSCQRPAFIILSSEKEPSSLFQGILSSAGKLSLYSFFTSSIFFVLLVMIFVLNIKPLYRVIMDPCHYKLSEITLPMLRRI